MVGHHERLVAGDGHAAIGADAAFAENAFVARLAVAPELAARSSRPARTDFVPSASRT